MKSRRRLWLAVGAVCFCVAEAAYVARPPDDFADLRRFHPMESVSGGDPYLIADFEVPPDQVRAALGIPPGREGYITLPNGDQVCLLVFSTDFRPWTCSVEAPPLDYSLDGFWTRYKRRLGLR
ncbi:MAG: hypothetical protein ACHQ50_07750 [Fimbriimonadales bacterium]